MPSLVQLEYVVAVANMKHFGQAAKACCVSQPTLSLQIKKVEDQIGVEIFDRMKKPVIMTPEGEIFVRQARLLLREHRILRSLFEQRGNDVSGEFRLGVIPTLTNSLLPSFIHEFSELYPEVILKIDELQTSSILKALEEDRLDGALMATPLGVEGLHEEPLFYETFQVYAAKGHRLLKTKSCRLKDLDPSDLWLLQDGHCFKDQVVQLCPLDAKSEAGLPRVQFQGGNLDTLLRLIKRGHGYTLLPSFMTHHMEENEIQAHVRKFQKPYPAREISLVTRRTQWKRKIAEAIKETIQQHLPKTLSREKNEDLNVLELC
ncbi:MAG: LysR family transcriptional regulator [Bdellovibrionaceae bacterium]|nr:LysR family transcriptional regulator [Pseudobdellovibrionaceae bacterium]